MTRLTGSALRVTIFIGENDVWHHRPLYTEIVHRARAAAWQAPASSVGSRASAPPR